MKTHAIYGPPGTGKTRRLTETITEITNTTNDVAVLSFSRAAAGVLTSRTEKDDVKFIGTIHSLAFAALGMSRSEVADPMLFAKWYGIEQAEAEVALSIYRYAKLKNMDLEEAYNSLGMGMLVVPFYLVQDLVTSYDLWKRNSHLFDFDDMLVQGIGKTPRYEVVIVDEAQDLSPVQWSLITECVAPGGDLIIAGDDDQAIFTWAGADPHGMISIADTSEILTQSWRIPGAVHRLAEATIEQVQNRVAKTYSPKAKEGQVSYTGAYLPTQVKGEHTVLCRSQWILQQIETELIDLCMPYVGGRGFFDRPRARLARAIMVEDQAGIKKLKKYLYPIWQDRCETFFPDPERWVDYVDMTKATDLEYRYLTSVDLFDNPQIELSTIHGFKGEESDHVVVVGDVSDIVESAADTPTSYEDEIRVWYVALTRAKEKLTIAGENTFIPVIREER